MFRIRMIPAISMAAGALWLSTSFAQVPADAPSGTTGQCKDGTYTSSASKRGSCRGHKGVQTWYASSDASSGKAATASAAPAPAPVAAAPSTAPAPAAQPMQSAPATAPAKTGSWTPPATAAPGGGPGMVWVNKSSHVYHCSSDKWYGKTKNGAYMSEADAKAEGDHADHNKPCS
jgi:hypothetical protein